jgi:DNA-binding LacI/PurR family transcriptional regulator
MIRRFWRHPAEAELAGFDDLPRGERLDPPLTVISQDPVALGGAAADLLFPRIEGGQLGAAAGDPADPVRGTRLGSAARTAAPVNGAVRAPS